MGPYKRFIARKRKEKMCNLFAHDEDKDPTENQAKCLLRCDINQSTNRSKEHTRTD